MIATEHEWEQPFTPRTSRLKGIGLGPAGIIFDSSSAVKSLQLFESPITKLQWGNNIK
jgi:hypothetical protein